MYKVFHTVLKRVRFYIFLMGIFLGLEIPLVIYTYSKLLPGQRRFVWVLTVIVGITCAYIVNFMIKGIIKEDYKMNILFDTKNYDLEEGEQDEKI